MGCMDIRSKRHDWATKQVGDWSAIRVCLRCGQEEHIGLSRKPAKSVERDVTGKPMRDPDDQMEYLGT
jgi:hypothetical protein